MNDDTYVAKLKVAVYDPKDERVTATVPLDWTVNQFVRYVMDHRNLPGEEQHVLAVDVIGSDGTQRVEAVDGQEPLMDVVRGLQRPPRIRHRDAGVFDG